MREFQLRIDLKEGLRPSKDSPRNTAYLTQLLNATSTEYGLSSYMPVVSFIEDDIKWPFPQLFKGKYYTLLADKDTIYTCDGTKLTKVISLNVNARQPWQFIDLWNFWILLCGNHAVIHTLQGRTPYVSSYDFWCETGAPFKGRVILGGFDSSQFWNATWQHFWEDWAGRHFGVLPNFEIHDNMIWYSTIGGGDVTWLFRPDLYMNNIMDFIQKNECGFIILPWQGRVKYIKPLKDYAIVYGEGGINALRLVGEPASTFGVIDLLEEINIKAIGGNESIHIFLSDNGILFSIDNSLKIQKLGYEEYLVDLLSDHILISFNEKESDFYISNGINTYILNRGLSKISQVITSGIDFDGQFQGIVGDSSGDFMLTTDVIDFSFRGVKNITEVDLGMHSTDDIYVAIEHRMDKGKNFSTTNWRKINKHGTVRIPIAGVEFRILVKGTNYSNIEPPDYMSVWYAVSDKRMPAILNPREGYETVRI